MSTQQEEKMQAANNEGGADAYPDLQCQFGYSESIKNIGEALAKAQAQIQGAEQDGDNPLFRSTYTTLTSVWNACRKALTDQGISVIQSPYSKGQYVTVTTMLLHASGEWIRGVLTLEAIPMRVDKEADKRITPQSVGSAITYARRFALASMVGVAPAEDDDANTASNPAEAKDPRPQADLGSFEDIVLDVRLRQIPNVKNPMYSVETKTHGRLDTWSKTAAVTAKDYKGTEVVLVFETEVTKFGSQIKSIAPKHLLEGAVNSDENAEPIGKPVSTQKKTPIHTP
jgi:hypothetical protein